MKGKFFKLFFCITLICTVLCSQSFATEKITYNDPVITGNNVRLSARAMNSQRLYSTEAGCYLGRTQDSMSLIGRDSLGFVSNYIDSWFDLEALEDGKYYYQFYWIIGGETRWGEVSSFIIGTESNASVSYSNIKVDIAGTKATIQGRASKSGNGYITGCGITVGTSMNNLEYRANDEGFSYKNYVDISYDTQTELNMTLIPGTTYYYQLHVIIDNKIYDDIVRSFEVPNSSGQQTLKPRNMNSEYYYSPLNPFERGWCTWYAFGRAAEVNSLTWDSFHINGNASQWLTSARNIGWSYGSEPRANSIYVSESLNHVAFVESVNSDGTISISEGGWGGQNVNIHVDEHVNPAERAITGYIYFN